ncbi:DUF932 domain-containing protein [Methylibium rhizosphaerae]|uniref:DUF932 domain-containing protein n=1 Tax=Methylibium rhizosphaerae TaxID=2570323 RepID=UPI001126F2A4|nr:DUF932 domain-containing protein [Methylibium rhizosphaerae]
MTTTPQLCTRFARNPSVLRSATPLGEDQMREVAPSIFAEGKHASRSARYTYIPTIDVLRGLRREGFEPFMVAQGASHIEGKAAFTKHMIRLRHAAQAQARAEAHEIILINSHDGASSYQMLAGMFRFVCCNGLVVGDVVEDLRIPHKGNVQDDVIDGAFRVLEQFETVEASTEAMKALRLEPLEQLAYGTAALALRFGEARLAQTGGHVPAPITAAQMVEARRQEDAGDSLWATFQRVQENALRGGQRGRSAKGRRLQTRPVGSIDRGVSLNRALWMLAEEMRKLKG